MAAPILSQRSAQIKREKLLQGMRQTPSAEEQNNQFFDIGALVGRLGSPYSSRKLTLAQMYEMRTDAVLMFAMLYGRMPLLTSRWYINSRSAQKAAFLTEAMKRIYGRLVLQYTTKWEFGWQALVKQFEEINPDWRYIDPADGADAQPRKVWDHGDIPAIVWKPFVPLKPEVVTPKWDSGGNLNGIILSAGMGGYSFPTVISSSNGNEERYVDLEHSLWVVNNRDGQFGSVWGQSRFQFSFKFWWAYEMLLGIMNRSAERKGDPTVVVRYPQGKSTLPDGTLVDNGTRAMQIGRLARSGSVLSMPSDSYTDAEDRPSKEKLWDVSYLTGGEEFEKLVDMLAYLDTQKIRSQMVADQAVQEGRGGTSSRNVAGEMGEQSQRMTIVEMAEFASDINEYMIPQLEELHFPELRDEPARFEFLDLGTQDLELYSMLLQGATNQQSDKLPIDWGEVLSRLKIPALTPEAIAARAKELSTQAEVQGPPELKAIPGGRAGVTDTGFYYEAPGLIVLSDDDVLLEGLPDTKHYSDSAVLSMTRLVRKLAKERYADQYASFAKYLESKDVKLAMEEIAKMDEPTEAKAIELADDEKKKTVEKILAGWKYTSEVGAKTVGRISQALGSIFSRAGAIELKRIGLSNSDWNPSEKELAGWVAKNAAAMVQRIDDTTKTELNAFLLNQVKKDKNAPQIAAAVRAHFSEFPNWKADRLARTEVRNFYNAATLFAAEAAGVKQVQALDGRKGVTDHDCEERNGRFFSLTAAWRENAKEHPNGTLAWRLIPGEALSIVRVSIEDSPEARAAYDREGRVIALREDLSPAHQGHYLEQIGSRLELDATLAA